MLLRNDILAVALLALLATACTNPINLRTASNYSSAGYAAMAAGDWAKARMNFGRAVQNAEIGRADPKAIGALWYEYGRASGVICDWPEAERGLNKSLELDSQSGGPAYMSLYELGRMNYDRKQYAEAVGYFARVKTEFDRMQADSRDPVSYAEYLDEYAGALEQTANASEAAPLRSRAAELRRTFPGQAGRTEKTPYGTQCMAAGEQGPA